MAEYGWLRLGDPKVQAFLKKYSLSPRQYAKHLLETVYHEPPVTINEFIDSPDYLDFKADLWPNVRSLLVEFDKPGYREGFFGLGKGSGKSALGFVKHSY